MTDVPRLSIEEALAHYQGKTALFVDIRDQVSIDTASIPGRKVLNNENVQDFVSETAKDQPLVVYCYHGNSSQSAAQFLSEQGFDQVLSIEGGFEAWRRVYPVS